MHMLTMPYFDKRKQVKKVIQRTLNITSSLGPANFACYSETLLYQGYKNNTIQRKPEIRDRQK